MKTVFVTGINGLLGTNVVNLLLEKGYHVKGLVRNIEDYKGLQSPHLQLIKGTLFDDYTTVLSDVDYLVHIAAVTGQNILDFAYYWRINSLATQQLHQAATKSKVKKFVFVSSANTLGYGSKLNPGTEEAFMRQPFNNSIYAQSKKSAENHLLEYKGEMKTIVVNPTFMLGAYDAKPSSGKIILMAWKKKVIFYPPGGKNFVHVEDVAKGILESFTKGRDGEKYLLSNANLSYREFFMKVNRVANQKPMMIQVPKFILLAVGIIGDVLRQLKVKTSISSVNMRILCINNYYSNRKSMAELNVNYQSIEKSISDAVNYFKKN